MIIIKNKQVNKQTNKQTKNKHFLDPKYIRQNFKGNLWWFAKMIKAKNKRIYKQTNKQTKNKHFPV